MKIRVARKNVVRFGLALAAFALGWALFILLPRWYGPETAEGQVSQQGEGGSGRTITARLFYLADDGLRLSDVEREMPYAEATAEQATHILEALFGPPPDRLLSPVPSGTRLRAVYVTERGDAFVDVSREAAANHPGGSLDEIFTVYAIVNAVAANLPAINAVQILVEGQEVDTLAGHVDLRHPLQQNLRWVDAPAATQTLTDGEPGGDAEAR